MEINTDIRLGDCKEILKYANMINQFTKEFTNSFCSERGQIDWVKLVEFNSMENMRAIWGTE